MSSNVILSISVAYAYGDLNNFVSSMRAFHPGSDIVIFVAGTTQEIIVSLLKAGIKVIPTDIKGINPAMYRYYAYKEFLEKNSYDFVFMSDVRDVVAQGDIFKDKRLSEGLHVFEEDAGYSIKDEKWNANWVLELYGSEIYENIMNERIICSGATFGDGASINCYLGHMVRELETRVTNHDEVKKRHGFDQGIHNYLCRSGPLRSSLKDLGKPLHIHGNGECVLTMGLMNSCVIRQGSVAADEGNGEIPPIIHQYDRKRLLKDLFNKKYKNKQESAD